MRMTAEEVLLNKHIYLYSTMCVALLISFSNTYIKMLNLLTFYSN